LIDEIRGLVQVPGSEVENYGQVVREREHQDRKWGEQHHTIPEWIAILGEEYGEACMAGNKMYWSMQNGEEYSIERYEQLMKELGQTAAVCLVMMKDLRGSHDARVQGR
jgi:hypothetical protein